MNNESRLPVTDPTKPSAGPAAEITTVVSRDGTLWHRMNGGWAPTLLDAPIDFDVLIEHHGPITWEVPGVRYVAHSLKPALACVDPAYASTIDRILRDLAHQSGGVR